MILRTFYWVTPNQQVVSAAEKPEYPLFTEINSGKKSRQNHNKNCYKTVNFEKMNEKHSGCNNSYTDIFFQWTTTKKAQFSRQNVLTWMGRLPPLGFSWLGDCGLEMILDMVLAVLLRDESVLESGSCYKTTNEKKRQATDGQDISSCVRRLKASPKKTTKTRKCSFSHTQLLKVNTSKEIFS